jgi:hypothetical protein
MSLRQIRPEVAAGSALLAGLSGLVVHLLTGRPVVGLVALVGALAAAALPLTLASRPGAVVPPADPADPDRASLVDTCIYLRDRVTSTALAGRLDQTLEQVGVSLVDPTGQRFDPSHHEAAGALATADDALVGTIAAVEAPGYADRGVLLRPPVVTVYQRRAS